jgi:hypothetical protein
MLNSKKRKVLCNGKLYWEITYYKEIKPVTKEQRMKNSRAAKIRWEKERIKRRRRLKNA